MHDLLMLLLSLKQHITRNKGTYISELHRHVCQASARVCSTMATLPLQLKGVVHKFKAQHKERGNQDLVGGFNPRVQNSAVCSNSCVEATKGSVIPGQG